MDSLRNRFAALDRIPVPDVWSDVEVRRASRATMPAARVVERTTRRRASTDEPVVLHGPRRIAKPARLLVAAALITVLAAAGLVVGPGLVQRLQAPLPKPSAVPSDGGPTPSVAATSTPTPLDTRSPAIALEATAFGTAWDPKPFGDVAWIRTDDAIYRTEDAGVTWRAVQPAGYSEPRPSAWPWASAFVDGETAYVNVRDGTTVAFTHDGGASWTTRTLDAGPGVAPTFTFRDARNGAATFVDPAAENAPEGTGLLVFTTADGGATWTGPIRSVQPGLPDNNKLGLVIGDFLVQSQGKAPGKKYNNDFHMSADGGATWTTYTFPINAISPRNDLKNLDAIVREPSGRLLVEFSASSDEPGVGHPSGIYESTDDPASWRLLATVPLDEFQFLSSTTWISSVSAEIRTSVDRGATWSTLISSTNLEHLGRPIFGSLTTAWFTIECRWIPDQPNCPLNQSPKLLFVTTDGGLHWREVGT